MDKEDEILEELKKTNRLLEEQKEEVSPFQAVMDMVKSLLSGVLDRRSDSRRHHRAVPVDRKLAVGG